MTLLLVVINPAYVVCVVSLFGLAAVIDGYRRWW